MKNRPAILLAFFLVLLNYNISWGMSSYAYNMIQESIYLFFSLACLVISLIIYSSLKGGSLATPWIFFVIGFVFAGAGGLIHLLDLFQLLIHEYDLRFATLIASCGSMLFLFLGLFIYKKGLD